MVVVVKKKNARALPPSVIESKKIWTKGGERERERKEREPRREFFCVCGPFDDEKEIK